MDKMSRFRRRVKPQPPPIETSPAERSSSDSGASSNGGAALAPIPSRQHAASPISHEPSPSSAKSDKLSPFRNFRLRSSSKRARSKTPNGANATSPAPGAASPSPLAPSVVISHEGKRPRSSAQSPRVTRNERAAPSKDRRDQPRMPSFLKASHEDIETRFNDITWAERERMAEGLRNQHVRDFKWGVFAQYDTQKKGLMDRYVNIKPWNHNRVRLKVPAGQVDYVNASTISMPSLANSSGPPLRYIAMQGPTEPSFPYVWRMIAEQTMSPAVIVQLTTMAEGGGIKCHQYFPLDGEAPNTKWTLNSGDVWGDGWRATLTNESVEKLEAGAIEKRKLVLRVKTPRKAKQSKTAVSDNETSDEGTSKEDETEEDEEGSSSDEAGGPEPLVVWHFLYRQWPDFGVPNPDDVPSFFELMKLSRDLTHPDRPRIIHCSAGVGRTGTFITLEHLMRELDAGALEHWDPPSGAGRDLIHDTVDTLRQQRKSMVQSDAQYYFLYQALAKLWNDKYNTTPVNASRAGDLSTNTAGADSEAEESAEFDSDLLVPRVPSGKEESISDIDVDAGSGPDVGGGVAIGRRDDD